MNAGYQSSLQWHEKKVETNYVIEGEAEVLLQNEDGTMESRTYKAGEGWCVPLKTKHRVIATTDYTALECSTAHLNGYLVNALTLGIIDGTLKSTAIGIAKIIPSTLSNNPP